MKIVFLMCRRISAIIGVLALAAVMGTGDNKANAQVSAALPVLGSWFGLSPLGTGTAVLSLGGEAVEAVGVFAALSASETRGSGHVIVTFGSRCWDFEGDPSANCAFEVDVGYRCVGDCLAMVNVDTSRLDCKDVVFPGCLALKQESQTTITGGTGRFQGATGNLHLDGAVAIGDIFVFDVRGVVLLP